MGEEAKTIEHLIKLRDSSRTIKTSFVETALLKDEDDPNAAAADEPDKKLTVSTPPALAGGDGTFQYFAKLGGLKNFEYSWGGWLSWGGSKIAGGDEPLFMQNKIL